jgi:branched-chain amino acid aminotransferase
MLEPLTWVDGSLTATLGEGLARELLCGASLAYGMAAFEGILCTEEVQRPDTWHVLRLDDHLHRLQRSVRALGWELPFTPAQLEQAVIELLRRLGRGCYYVRPLVFSRRSFTEHDQAGSSKVHVAITCARFAFPLFLLQMNRGRRATVVRSFRPCWPPQQSGAKLSGKYLALLAALAEAQQQRYDEAILLDGEGQVAEASTANLFIVRQGTLVTPPTTWALPGVTRRCVLELATSLGLRCEERTLSVEEMLAADEIFATNTARGIVAIEEIDGRWQPRGQEQTRGLRQAYIQVLTGEDAAHAAWLTPISTRGAAAGGR